MHILFLTQILPYPPDSGPKVKTWNVLKYLYQQDYKITLVSFVRSEEFPFVGDVKKNCSTFHCVPMKRSRVKDIGYYIRSQLTGRPFLIERDDYKAMRTIVNNIISAENIDIIHADQLTMAQFAFPYASKGTKSPALIFDAHNAVWTIIDRMKENSPFYLKVPLGLEANRIKKYEAQITRSFNQTLAVSDLDKDALIEAVQTYNSAELTEDIPITVIPIAIDTKLLRPAKRIPDSLNILTLGTLYYPPNADGIRWFVQEIFPLIRKELPGVSLTIVGRNPPDDLINSAEDSEGAITVTGYVPDLDPYFDQSALVVVPVRAGGGMRVRILEAFARGMPVVTTTVGLEGIEAVNDSDVLLRDTPSSFADAVIHILKDQDLQSKLAVNGRRLAVNSYEWQVVLQKLKLIYDSIEIKKHL